MDLEVFEAARNGSLKKLKALLNFKQKEYVAVLLLSRTNGATPLIGASLHGHSRVAAYLIKNCHVDVDQIGSVNIDGKTIYGATALWCAAATGHLHLVKVLLKYKAFVNCETKEKTTPLFAACFQGHFEVAKYLIEHGADIEICNAYNYTCLIAACDKEHFVCAKYLIECKADVNKKTSKGHTALHASAKSGRLDMTKLLLENGAIFESDYYGTTPFIAAASAGCSRVARYLAQNFTFTEYDKIKALELIGAAYMYVEGHMAAGLFIWECALKCGYRHKEYLLEKCTVNSPIASYLHVREFNTFSQFEELKSDPEQIRKQALLVKERILGPGHPDTHKCIMDWGWYYVYAGRESFDRCFELWMYDLDVQQSVHEPLSDITQDSLLAFLEVFFHIKSNTGTFTEIHPAIIFRDILKIFERVLKEIKAALQLSMNQLLYIIESNQFHCIFRIAIHFIVLMCQLQPHLDKNGEILLKEYVHQFVQMNPRSLNGWTPLHFACFKHTSILTEQSVCTFPSCEVIDLLLDVGACPNAMDLNNNTPLHIAAMNESCEITVFKSLLKHGAHLDIRNFAKETPLQLMQSKPVMIYLYPLQHINLQCLCAQAVKSNRIPYARFVHKSLEDFIDFH